VLVAIAAGFSACYMPVPFGVRPALSREPANLSGIVLCAPCCLEMVLRQASQDVKEVAGRGWKGIITQSTDKNYTANVFITVRVLPAVYRLAADLHEKREGFIAGLPAVRHAEFRFLTKLSILGNG